MIIVDFQQIAISNLMVQLGQHTNAPIQEAMLRHMILNTIRANNVKFRNEYGKMVIACDARNSWRKEAFPYYKANRKQDREKSDLPWNMIFESLLKIQHELKEEFPYIVIMVDRAEGDDIIGTLVHNRLGSQNFFGGERSIILSGDKDFVQLHTYTNIFQYDPVRKKEIVTSSPEDFLMEHIAHGDKGDGVPNVLSADNCLVIKERQKKVTAKKLEAWKQEGLGDDEALKLNWKRNTRMIDLTYTPKEIVDNILTDFDTQISQQKDRTKLLGYFRQHNLRTLTEALSDF